MYVDPHKALTVFQLVAELEVQMAVYCRDAKQIPVPWQNVVDTVEQMTKVRITVIRVDVPAEGTNGSIRRYSDNTADIIVQRGMSEDLDNFTIIKEATHPLIDAPGDMSPDGVATLKELVKSSWYGNGDGKHDLHPILQSEHLATIAAAAIVVPRSRRLNYKQEMAEKKTTLGKIAIELNVPEHIVSLALDDEFNRLCEEALKSAAQA
jgi:Zn-dependent peptidase ImmA (M78 family)